MVKVSGKEKKQHIVKLIYKNLYIVMLILAFLIIPNPTSLMAEMSMSVDGHDWPTFTFTNTTAGNITFKGFRVKSACGGYTSWAAGFTRTGAGPYQYEQRIASTEATMYPGRVLNSYGFGQTCPTDFYDMQLLLKTGGCEEPDPLLEPAASTCAGLTAITAAPSYYSTTCVPWSASSRGGAYGGGMLNTFYGTTQIQVAVPNTTYSVNSTSVKWDPVAMGGNGTMYMMATAMGQEYFNIEMLSLFGHGAKEGFAALYNSAGSPANAGDQLFIEANAAGVNGTYHIEQWTLGRVIMTYPNFFPRHLCASSYADVTTAMAAACVSGDGGWIGTGNYYMCSTYPGGCPYIAGTSAQLVNSVVSSGLNMRWVYDALALSTRLCFYQFLQCSNDPKAAEHYIGAAYNLGINSGFESSLTSQPCASNNLLGDGITPVGNSNYMTDVMATYNLVESAQSCGGAPIYNQPITITDLQTFFFGNGGTAAAPGYGGLWVHMPELYSSAATRTAMWADVTCAFNYLKNKAPGSNANAISFRYDFLSILRVAKQYFSTAKPYPSNDEFNTWVTNHSTSPSPCGMTTDDIFPTLLITAPNANTITSQCPNFPVNFTASDNIALEKVEWSLNPNWLTWNSLAVSGTNYTFNVPGTEPNYPAPGAVGKIWVRVTDTCGNATIQEIRFRNSCGTPTATATNTRTNTQTSTRTATPSMTPTFTRTNTRTITPTLTMTFTMTTTRTYTQTATPTVFPATFTSTPTFTPTFTRTDTPTMTQTATPSPTRTDTRTATPSVTITTLDTSTVTRTVTPTNTITLTATPTVTRTFTQTVTPTSTDSPQYTFTITPSVTETSTPTFTRTFTRTITPTSTDSPQFTHTITKTVTETFTPTLTRTVTNTHTPTFSVTSTPTITLTSTDTPQLTRTPTATVTMTLTYTLTQTPSATITLTPTPEPGDIDITMEAIDTTTTFGGSAEIKIMIRNNGGGFARGVNIFDLLPSEVDFEMIGSSAGWVDSAGNISLIYGDIPPGGYVELRLVIKVKEDAATDTINIPGMTANYTDDTNPGVTQVRVSNAIQIKLGEIQIYPNPFNPSKAVDGKMKFMNIPKGTRIIIYTISGEKVNMWQTRNSSSVLWDGKNMFDKDVSAGIYYYVITNENKSMIKSGKIFISR